MSEPPLSIMPEADDEYVGRDRAGWCSVGDSNTVRQALQQTNVETVESSDLIRERTGPVLKGRRVLTKLHLKSRSVMASRP